MSQQSKELSDQFAALNNEMISVLENCTDDQIRKTTQSEQWSVGVVARHVADGHYGLLSFIQLMVAGEKLPEIDMDAIDQMSAQHAIDHANCTKAEVTDLLRKNGTAIVDYVAGLNEEDINRSTYFSLFGGDVSVKQIVEYVLINSCTEHLESIKATLAG
jgi:hypothetical protein